MREWHLYDKITVRECKFEQFFDEKVYAKDGLTYSLRSLDEYISFCYTALADLQTMHSIGPGEFEQVNKDEIKVVFPVTYFSAPEKAQSASQEIRGGYYFETYQRMDDDWMMTDSKMERVYEK
ncbi:hypothetical protein V8C35DRAFT_318566 [Trichoderma chlorosporum]